eukprot:14117284-Ditylum_brightwellii.AAC.1
MDQPVHGTSTGFIFNPVGQTLAAVQRYSKQQGKEGWHDLFDHWLEDLNHSTVRANNPGGQRLTVTS